ncbi:PqqD family protein [Allosphingosinicella sp.]|uniref:PqqD family protein n=1 Tax=Allosphingosinicella sp. TaxID=2823234 RepID=UPI002F0E2E3C
MGEDPVVRRCEGMIEAEVDGELIGLHVDQGNCYGFNSTATRIWGLIEQPRRLSELREALLADYEVDPETCERELLELLRELEGSGLVKIEAPKS